MKSDVSYKALRTLPSAYDKDSIDFMIFVSFFLIVSLFKDEDTEAQASNLPKVTKQYVSEPSLEPRFL